MIGSLIADLIKFLYEIGLIMKDSTRQIDYLEPKTTKREDENNLWRKIKSEREAGEKFLC